MIVNGHLVITIRRHRQAHGRLNGMHRRCPRACADRKGGVEQPVGRADELSHGHPAHRGGDLSPYSPVDRAFGDQRGRPSGNGHSVGFLIVTTFLVVLAIDLIAWFKKIKWL